MNNDTNPSLYHMFDANFGSKAFSKESYILSLLESLYYNLTVSPGQELTSDLP